ncbi:hypothetical protein ACWOFR_04230 [Carnobacterium gallinarum]|uniref:hypothetical protein n=1 Tax=Carnobacterium gallinarum TaxID=2749 RepID=UPI000556D7E2|nr:hypothetical protein [Carnobacterium gallinarum]
MKANINYYAQAVNTAITDTEEIGESLNPHFEVLKEALDQNKVTELSVEQLTTIKEKFAEGTEKYRGINTILVGLKAPVKVLGVHKQLLKSYSEFIRGCQEMTDSIDAEKQAVDTEVFTSSEAVQDVSSDSMMKTIQRITKILF